MISTLDPEKENASANISEAHTKVRKFCQKTKQADF